MKYKCLVFDHDDTIVNSTATVHYPCFQEYLDINFPGKKISLDEYFEKNFTEGFLKLCREEYYMSEQQIQQEEIFWDDYVKKHVPDAYPLIREIMEEHKRQGGITIVASHSFSDNIIRDFKYNNLPLPDAIYGWELPEEKRKPNPYTLIDVMDKYNLEPKDILVIDDAKPGYDMAVKCNVDFGAVGWSTDVKIINDFMRKNCTVYFDTVNDLKEYLQY